VIKQYLLAPGPTPVPPEVMAAMAGPVIELSGVEKRYGGHAALAGVDLSIEAGAGLEHQHGGALLGFGLGELVSERDAVSDSVAWHAINRTEATVEPCVPTSRSRRSATTWGPVTC